jgi:DNA (cytosine-5)-methyltransferase 1
MPDRRRRRSNEVAVARKVISLFSGVGGLDFGFESAGYETVVTLDSDPVACHALEANRSWPVIKREIGKVTSREILDTAGLRESEADVLIGGPPCQPFSKSGYWATGDARRLDDPRADTLRQYMRVLRDTLPKAFLLENVPGLAYRGKSEGIEAIRCELDAINEVTGTCYSIRMKSLNAAEFGVPQLRERVFVVGSRDGEPFDFPSTTHVAPKKVGESEGKEPFMTAWDALGDLPIEPNNEELAMSGKWADLLPTIPEGQNYLWHTERGGGERLFGWRRRYWSFLLKLSKTLPSWTIQAQPGPATGPFHWRNRKLSAAELCRLQTFPDGLRFTCRRAETQKLIGNAVPSALAEVLAREIRRQLLGDKVRQIRPRLLPPRRGDPPAPERVLAIPAKYHALIGEHEKHPGTGRGCRAAERVPTAA